MSWLCDASEFLTRGQCGTGWAPWLRQTYQMANFLIWFSTLVIALSLSKLYRRKKAELPAPDLFVAATAFLLLCGLSHLGDLAAFLWAPYRLLTLVDVMTAAFAVAVACRIPSVVQWMTELPAQEFVHTVNRALESQVWETVRTKLALKQEVEELRERNRALEHLIKTHAWITAKSAALEELSGDLSRDLLDREMA